MGQLHLIADDLAEHCWYVELADRTICAIEELLASWAAFDDYAAEQDAA